MRKSKTLYRITAEAENKVVFEAMVYDMRECLEKFSAAGIGHRRLNVLNQIISGVNEAGIGMWFKDSDIYRMHYNNRYS